MDEFYEKYLISDVARMFKISPGTLRHYEKIGLIDPIKDSNTKYRHFDIDLLEQISSILLFRAIKLPLEEIININNTSESDLDNITDIMQKHIKTKEITIEYLKQQLEKTDNFIEEFSTVRNNIDKIVIKASPRLSFTSFNKILSPKQLTTSYYDTMIKSSFIPKTTFILRKEELVYNANINLDSYCNFGISIMDNTEDNNGNLIFPCQTCAYTVITFSNYDDLWKRYGELINWIYDNNYYPSGNGFDHNFLSIDDYHLFEIYIPIESR